MPGGITGSLLVPALAGASSPWAVLLLAAAAMLLAAGLSVRLRAHGAVPTPHATASASVGGE